MQVGGLPFSETPGQRLATSFAVRLHHHRPNDGMRSVLWNQLIPVFLCVPRRPTKNVRHPTNKPAFGRHLRRLPPCGKLIRVTPFLRQDADTAAGECVCGSWMLGVLRIVMILESETAN